MNAIYWFRSLLCGLLVLGSLGGCGGIRRAQTAVDAPPATAVDISPELSEEGEPDLSGTPPPESALAEDREAAESVPAAVPALRFTAIPEDPRPGEPVTIALMVEAGTQNTGWLEGAAESPRAVLLNRRDQPLSRAPFFTLDETVEGNPLWIALLTVPSTAAPGPALIRIESQGVVRGAIPLVIGERDFIAEEILLDQGNTDIRTQPDPQKNREADQLWAIITRMGSHIYAGGAFEPPVASTRRTSFFGDRRLFRYVDGGSDTSIHAGVDYGVPRGTAVHACASGLVVLARFRIVTGNSVILEHFPGVYSLYYHLDALAVEEGELVSAGALLGESGSTGLSTGPHLHWEIRVAGENTDPDACIARPILDKEAILSKIRTDW